MGSLPVSFNMADLRVKILKTDCHALSQLKESRKKYDEKYPSFDGTGPMYRKRWKGRTQKCAQATIIPNQETRETRLLVWTIIPIVNYRRCKCRLRSQL
jgi:hypothetical protein